MTVPAERTNGIAVVAAAEESSAVEEAEELAEEEEFPWLWELPSSSLNSTSSPSLSIQKVSSPWL